MKAPIPVFVIATQRSGTNYLRSILRGTGIFVDFDEVFHSEINEDKPADYAYFNWAKHSYFNYRAAKVAQTPALSIPFEQNVAFMFDDYLNYLATAAVGKRYFLIDVKYNSLHHFDPIWQSPSAPKFIFELLRQRNCHVLHLVRENFFDVYLSSQLTHVTRKYVRKPRDKLSLQPIVINIDKMFWNIRKIETEVEMIRNDLAQVARTQEFTYDAITTNSQKIRKEFEETIREYFEENFCFQQDSTYIKIIKDRWSIVSNAAEVKSALKSSEYARFV